jgi:hypothetical protein
MAELGDVAADAGEAISGADWKRENRNLVKFGGQYISDVTHESMGVA